MIFFALSLCCGERQKDRDGGNSSWCQDLGDEGGDRGLCGLAAPPCLLGLVSAVQDDEQVLGCLEDKTHQSRVCAPGGVKFLSLVWEGLAMMNFSSSRFGPEQIL